MAVQSTGAPGRGRAAATAFRDVPGPLYPSGPLPGIPANASVSGRRPLQPWLRRYVVAAVLVDLLGAAAAGALATVVRPGVGSAGVVLALFPLVWVLLVCVCEGHNASALGAGDQEFRSLGRAALVLLAALACLSLGLDLEVSRGLVIVAVPGAVVAGSVGRYALRRWVHRLRQDGRCMRTVVAVGREGSVLELVRQLRRERHCGMTVVAACVTRPEEALRLRAEGVLVIGDLQDAADMCRIMKADIVAVTSASETAATYLRRLSWDLEGSGIELLVAPGLMEVAGPRLHMRPFIGLPLLYVEAPEFTGPKRLVKGALDRVAAATALLLVLPVLAAVALAIRLDSPGPVLFRQQRIGEGGRPFTMVKFRTMVADAEARQAELLELNQNADGLLFKMREDPRVTAVGRVLRRFSLDELPQLFNVLVGQMSLVGPRPPLPSEAERYDDSVRRRLLVKPGLTGLWQVSGRSDLSWEESVRLDLRYVENWSLFTDLMILWKTAFAVVRARGAY